MRAAPGDNVHHTLISMFFALLRLLTAFDSEIWSPRAGTMCAVSTKNAYHAALGMCLAIHAFLSSLNVEARYPRATVV